MFETPDPWNYGSDYEQVKYQRTLDLVPSDIQSALEIACAQLRSLSSAHQLTRVQEAHLVHV